MINPGDVIKVNDNVPTFGGCLMYVDRVYYWGVQAGIKLPGEDGKRTFIRLLSEDFTIIAGGENNVH